jgi:cell division septal protein FtsQ
MRKPRKKRKNRYQESTFGLLKGNFRAFRGFLAFFAIFCFIILLGSALSRVYYQLVNGRWLRLEKIEITGTRKLDRVEILNTMGLKKGQCTLSINTKEAAESLRKLPEVREAEVRLDLRGRVETSIVERTAAAIVACGDRNMEMDVDGILFSEATPDDGGTAPLITGLCGPGAKKGDSIAPESLGQIKELLAAIDNSKSWLSGTAISECRWSETGFTLVMGERAVPVELGKDGLRQKITKLRRVIFTLNAQGLTDLVTRIDLDCPGRTFLEGHFPLPHPVQGKQPG